MADLKENLFSIHFVFQYLAGHGRDKLFKQCFDSWLKTFRPEDSIVVVTSNGVPQGLPDLPNITYINCPKTLLAVNKRNMGISLSDKTWTMLVDDDILLKDYQWREKLEAVVSYVGRTNSEAFYSLAPVVPTHKAMGKHTISGEQWSYMERMGFNCVLSRTIVWKSLPHINWAFSADKTYLDYITNVTKVKLYRHTKGMVDHMVTDRMKTHFIKEKFRMIKEHKHEWYSQMHSQVCAMKSFLKNYTR